MSLQVWLPFTDGTLKQQGLLNSIVAVTGTTGFTDGKLGKALSCNGSSYWSVPGVTLGSSVSIACWGKTSTGSKMLWVLESDASDILNFYWSSIYTLNTGDSNNNPFQTDSGSNISVLTDGNWHHFVVTFDSSVSKLYIDGEYAGKAKTFRNPTTTNKKIKIGGGYINGHSYDWNGAINDFRLYDHCLSPMEVKRISQGLILHYPLNNMGFGQENLAKNSNLGWNSTAYNVIQGEMYEDWVVGDTYTITIKGTPSSGCKFGLWSDTGNANMCYFYNKIKDDIWIATATCSASRNTTKFSVWDYPSNNPTHNAHIEWIKIEKGSIATPWSPALSDTLADTMGLNSNIEYDTSGYCNNGTWHGTHTNTSNTPKYTVSTTATGGASTYLEGPILPADAQTAALWIKCKKSQNAAIFNDKTSGLQIGLLNSLLYMNSKTSTAGFTTTHWKDDNWNHVVVTYDGTTRKAYINGEAETQSGASNYYIHNADNCWLWNRSYNNSYPFNGSLSDLRVYTTALSATDVKSLYQNSATIDADGTIHGAIR